MYVKIKKLNDKFVLMTDLKLYINYIYNSC